MIEYLVSVLVPTLSNTLKHIWFIQQPVHKKATIVTDKKKCFLYLIK